MERILRDKLPGGSFRNVKARTSRTMSAIAGKHTKTTERAFRMALVRAGLKGWVLQARDVIGKPAVYFPYERVAVFLDGCFWHGCPGCGHIPKTNVRFWRTKIARNQERDQQTTRRLRAKGISVVRIWEHNIRDGRVLARRLMLLCKKLQQRS